MSTVAFQDNTPGGTADSPKTGYLAGIISSGATDAQISVSNTGTENANFYYRKTGTTTFSLIQLLPGLSEEFWLSLTSARTIEYYFDAGTIQVSVVDFRTYGSTSAPVTAFTATVPAGSSGSPETGDLSAVVSAGSTLAILRFSNIGDANMNLYVRKTGTTDWGQPLQISPGAGMERWISLTAARTVEYYFDAGSLKCEVVNSQITTTIPITDVDTWLVMNGYPSLSILSLAQIEFAIAPICAEVEKASERHLAIAMYALDASIKNDTIVIGAGARCLQFIRNRGSKDGLMNDKINVSSEDVSIWDGKYEKRLTDIRSGIVY